MEISELFYFAMDHPDLDVAVPQDLARCAADLAEMRRTKGSEWQKCCAKLYGYIGENVRDILADFDEHYKRSPEDDASWGHTHTTQPHATHTYMQDARKAVEEPVHPPTPAPHHTHTTPNPPLLTPPLNQSPILHAAWDYGENAENAQEKAGDRGVRMGGDVDDSGGTELIASQDERGGGTEFFASQDEPHEEDAGDQATAEEGDGRPTHSTHTHVTHTYTQDARKAAEGPVNPLTPIPHQPQIIPSSPIPHTRAAARAAPAVSEPTSLTGKTQTHFDAPRVGTHTSTPEAEFSSAIVSARLGPQENIDRDRKIRTGGDVDGGGGTELFASQDESHEEDVGEQATAEDEEEQDSGEWVAEEEHEEDEEAPATEAGGSEGSNESVSTDSHEELPVLQASDGEEDNERSVRRFGYNPDNGDVWGEYQPAVGDPMFAC